MLGIRNVELGVLARYEVAGCEGVACATRAAIVPVRTDIDEEIATFAKQAVPQPTHLRGVDATESIGAAADRASPVGTAPDSEIAPGVRCVSGEHRIAADNASAARLRPTPLFDGLPCRYC